MRHAVLLLAAVSTVFGAEPPPKTRVVAVLVDRDSVRLIRTDVKDRPFSRKSGDRNVGFPHPGRTTLEFSVLDKDGAELYVGYRAVGPVCLEHPVGTEDHVDGDTGRSHRISALAEIPDLPEAASIRWAWLESRALGERKDLGTTAASALDEPDAERNGTVLWPEDFGETVRYRVFGNEAESHKRYNIVVVPDGFTHDEKHLIDEFMEGMVNAFRWASPFRELDPLINYTLVYAYSVQSGVDECDCNIVVDNAMSVRFPKGLSCPQDSCPGYGGGGCDFDSSSNIAAAESRAPAQDDTIVLANSPRGIGCAWDRAVTTTGLGQTMAVHEFAHVMAALGDEYWGLSWCGDTATEINTSVNMVVGAWPEWYPELGRAREGAQKYNRCVFRPADECVMLGHETFCAVCRQHVTLTLFGHPRVEPTAPIESSSPASPLNAVVNAPVTFSVAARLPVGDGVANAITWTKKGPSDAAPRVVATGSTSLPTLFGEAGKWTVTCEVNAASNFVKPEKAGANVESVSWSVTAKTPGRPREVSPPGTPEPLRFTSRTGLTWESAASSGSLRFNAYRGDLATIPTGDYGTCLASDIPTNTLSVPEDPPIAIGWTYLVAGENAVGEGPLGFATPESLRVNLHPCP